MFRDLVLETKEHIGGCTTSVTLLEVPSLPARMNYYKDLHRNEYEFPRCAINVPKKFLYKRAVRVCEHVNTIVVSLASVLFTVCFRITALEEAKHN